MMQQQQQQQQQQQSESMNVTSSNGSNGSMTTSQACAACKFQRRKCPVDCPLAPYFPAEANQRFLSCKRLFGVSNMLRFLRDADPADKEETMKSLIYEAEVRDKDPVHGCYGIISQLTERVRGLQRELELTRSLVHQHHHLNHHHHQQQPSASLLQPEFAQPLLSSVSSSCNNTHPLALPLSSTVAAYSRSSGASSLALDDPFDFESIDHKYILRP
ncbi:LOB domain-containing protein 22 [Selaginella moellendorffii]|nr:LOB domain-containing protein 22 [Selaginella moellendorffii]|eukprot:XP_002986599.2 LOB domain-containing protein 22 [Selaginella moellendorffii]